VALNVVASHMGELSRPDSSLALPIVFGDQNVLPGTGFDPRHTRLRGGRRRYLMVGVVERVGVRREDEHWLKVPQYLHEETINA
jgi:hypothetical protein